MRVEEEIVELADVAGRQTDTVGVQADNPLTFADLAQRARSDEPPR